MKSKFVGFFPKENDYGDHLKNKGITKIYGEQLKNKGITEICSVSECIRGGPKGWIDLWKHNDLVAYK